MLLLLIVYVLMPICDPCCCNIANFPIAGPIKDFLILSYLVLTLQLPVANNVETVLWTQSSL